MRFECQRGCVACCEQKGDVYLTRDDVARMAEHLGISRAEFRRLYVCGEPPEMRLREPRHKACAFLLADGCSVHAAKPLQCRAFPFWPELLNSASERAKAMSYCPGLGKGESVDMAQARRTASEIQQAFGALYAPEPV